MILINFRNQLALRESLLNLVLDLPGNFSLSIIGASMKGKLVQLWEIVPEIYIHYF